MDTSLNPGRHLLHRLAKQQGNEVAGGRRSRLVVERMNEPLRPVLSPDTAKASAGQSSLNLEPQTPNPLCLDCDHYEEMDYASPACDLVINRQARPSPCQYSKLRQCPLGKWSASLP